MARKKKPDDAAAAPVRLSVTHSAAGARGGEGTVPVRDTWGDGEQLGRVREAMRSISRIAHELAANSTLNFEVLAALDLLEMVCDATSLLTLEMPTPTPNPLARRVAAAKIALRGSMANKGVLQLAVVEFLQQLTEPATDTNGKFRFPAFHRSDGETEDEAAPRAVQNLKAAQRDALEKACGAAQALVASTRPPTPARMLVAIMNLRPPSGRRRESHAGPTEERKWQTLNDLLREMGLGSEQPDGLARSLRGYRREQGQDV